MAAPMLATMRITNGRQGKEEVPVVKSRAFQLTVGESQAAPDVVTGMYLYHIFYCFPFLCLFFI